MNKALSRRQLLSRAAYVGIGSTITSFALSGCGAGTASGTTALEPLADTATATTDGQIALGKSRTKSSWTRLQIGAGGWVSGIDVAADGTKVIRCDTYNAYLWSNATARWEPMLTALSMPAGEFSHETVGEPGVYEVAIAPSNSSIMYVVFNGFVFKTTNRGVSFTKTAMTKFTGGPNDGYRSFGRKMVVDPVNPDVVYLGTQAEGLYYTTNGGTSWTRHAQIPASLTAAGIAIAFDPSRGSQGGRTQGIFVSSQGSGVYQSVNAGQSFALTPSTPKAHRRMVCAPNGTLYLTEDGAGANNLRQFKNGVWSTLAAGGDLWHSLAINPANSAHLVAATGGGTISQSFDAGATWTGLYYANYPVGSGVRVATDIPWLAWTKEDYMSNGDMVFDPSVSNKLMFVEGIGVWWTNPPATRVGFTWTSQSLGIEQLVCNRIVSPPDGSPLFLSWDRPVFKIDNPRTFPTSHGPNRDNPLCAGWNADYAIDNPRVIAAVLNWYGVEQSGYSTDGGATWTKFASVPAEVTAGKIGGSIAVSTSNNMVWLPSNNGNPYVTTNRGVSWQQIALPGIPTSGSTGWGWAYYLNRHVVVADKVTPGTFYLYNYLASGGVYRSTDGGLTWTKVYSGAVATWSSYNASMAAVPGKAGHLFFTSGQQDGANPSDTQLMRSINGGTSWAAVPGMTEVYAFGFGRAQPWSTYPAIFAAGYYQGVWGIWRSYDNAATWVSIGSFPLNIIDKISCISGDANLVGRVYLGLRGSGALFADDA